MKMNSMAVKGLFFLLFTASAATAQQSVPQLGKSPVQDVVKAMTLEEKVDLLVGQGMFLPGMPIPGSPTVPSEAQKKYLVLPVLLLPFPVWVFPPW